MSRIAGIVIFFIGLLMLLATVTKVALGLGDPGIIVMLVGLVAFGVSFIPRRAPAADAPPPLSFADKFKAIFFEPSEVFKNLRFHPRWLGGFLVLALFMLTYQIAFVQRMTPERMAIQTVDKMVERGVIPQDEAPAIKARQVERANYPFRQAGVLGSQVALAFLLMMFLAGVYMLCMLVVSGEINYWQALSVAVYSALPPVVIASVLNLMLLYIKSRDDIDVVRGQRGLAQADLGILVSQVEHPMLYIALSFIGVFTLYGWWLTAKGLQNTGTRVSAGAAWSIALILWVLSILFAVLVTALVPGMFG